MFWILIPGVNILPLSMQFMIGIVIYFQLPLDKFLEQNVKSRKEIMQTDRKKVSSDRNVVPSSRKNCDN